MRCARGVLALICSGLLGLALIAVAQPGAGPALDLGKRWAAAAPSGNARVVVLDLGKRWA
jgi:hypothetical protein